MINCIYAPLGLRGTNDETLQQEDSSFWGFKESIGRKIKQGDIMLGLYTKEKKINYFAIVDHVFKSKYICDKVWKKEKVNTVKNATTEWDYIVILKEIKDLTGFNIPKSKIQEAFDYEPKWTGQQPAIKEENEKINQLINEIKSYRT